jgi:uncharacterized membrane protein
VKRTTWQRALKRHLVAGLIVIAPLTATIWVLLWIFQLLDGMLGRFLYPALGLAVGRDTLVVPGLGMLALFLLLITVGWLAERAIGSRAIKWWNGMLESLPVVRRIYGASNRIVRTVFGSEARPFSQVVLVEYPAPGRWSIGFLAGEGPREANARLGDLVAVFVPTTPNPTSGWIVLLRRELVTPLAMSVDEAFTLILSAGAVRPQETPAAAMAAAGAPDRE